jgi:serine/threonine-protein kinase HipA
MRTQTTLDVWMNGTFVGRWSRDKGVHTFEYDVSYVQNPNACPLSLSLPLYQTSVGTFVESFFDNLLPDSFEIRRRLARRFGCASDSAFDILAETGRDCVGALQILKKDSPIPSVRTVEKQALTEHEIELLLLDAVSNNPISVNNDDFFRISLAGAQEKTALLSHDGSWCMSLGATPSTHIIKLPIRAMNSLSLDLHNSVENEWLCLQILQAFGLPVAQADMHDFGNQRVLVVKRFDRKLSGDGSWYVRIPQEDFCQAHGLPSSRKYEVDKGVGIQACMDLLQASSQAYGDRKTFLSAHFLYWLMAAPDAHAKNFSLYLEQQGRFRMTPLYDVLSLHPVIGKGKGQIFDRKVTLAMGLERRAHRYGWSTMQRQHWLDTAKLCGAEHIMQTIMDETLHSLPQVLDCLERQLPQDFPQDVAQPIFNGMRKAALRLQS